MSYPITALLIGQAAPFRGAEYSAIAKSPVSGLVTINQSGLAGDQQADRKHHGGPHMAVHVYPADHYAHWRGVIGDHPLLDLPGAFGENIAASGLTEEIAVIGDRFRMGTALLEISQPRKPCWKIEHHFGHKGMVANILQTGRCGIYFRVLEDGAAQAGDRLGARRRRGTRLERPPRIRCAMGQTDSSNPPGDRATRSNCGARSGASRQSARSPLAGAGVSCLFPTSLTYAQTGSDADPGQFFLLCDCAAL